MYTCPMHPEIQEKLFGDCPKCGMALESKDVLNQESQDSQNLEYLDMLKKFKLGVLLGLPLLIISMSSMFMSLGKLKIFELYFELILASIIVFYCGRVFFYRGWQSVKNRNLNMFSLISMGVGVAYVYSFIILIFNLNLEVYFESAGVIIVLVLLGQVLELKARSQTGEAIKSLLGLVPKGATLVKSDGTEGHICLDKIKLGDKLRIKPGEKIPIDGEVLEGESYIDESMISGEPRAVKKNINCKVIAGTVNQNGSLIIIAQKVGKDTVLSQIVELVAKAQRSQAPVQKLADQISGYFVPAVLGVSALSFVCWYFFGPQPSLQFAIINSVAVLIIACPCALGLATPMSIMVATGQGAKSGVLIKNAEVLETFEKVKILMLDKTGTLTEGKPKVLEIKTYDNFSEQEVLNYAQALEKSSEHPIAQAILAYRHSGQVLLNPESKITNFKAHPGMGISGQIENKEIKLGNQKFVSGEDFKKAQENSFVGTQVFISINNQLAGLIIIADEIKSNAKSEIKKFHELNTDIVMLTGDNWDSALGVAEKLGVDQVHAELMPADKLDKIKDMQHKKYLVAMAGDGINDAPALAQANVGIAMGTGTDVAIHSADITLLKGDLSGIIKAKKLSKACMKNIRQNLFFAFIYNGLGVPVAAGILYPFWGILLNPMIASAAMSLSSVCVILNALRLKNM